MQIEPGPHLDVSPNAAAAARHGAQRIAAALSVAVARRGKATLAVSGGRTPQRMFEHLAAAEVPWERVDLFQVDERVAPAGHPDRNSMTIEAAFVEHVARYPERFHWMPVEAVDLEAAAGRYASELQAALGPKGALDVVHLGLGSDGHTASIFPGSPLVAAPAGDVAVVPAHLGHRRMTLTLPVLNRARAVLWLVAGADKRAVLSRLLAGDAELVASCVRRDVAWIVADAAAASAQ
jgi:6-phosphogluconolactonase